MADTWHPWSKRWNHTRAQRVCWGGDSSPWCGSSQGWPRERAHIPCKKIGWEPVHHSQPQHDLHSLESSWFRAVHQLFVEDFIVILTGPCYALRWWFQAFRECKPIPANKPLYSSRYNQTYKRPGPQGLYRVTFAHPTHMPQTLMNTPVTMKKKHTKNTASPRGLIWRFQGPFGALWDGQTAQTEDERLFQHLLSFCLSFADTHLASQLFNLEYPIPKKGSSKFTPDWKETKI